MTTMTDLAGYLASTMVLLTFMMKDMRLLRVVAIASNIAFITYGVLAWLPPVFCLHALLLPVNTIRLLRLLAEEGLAAVGPALVRCHERFRRNPVSNFVKTRPGRVPANRMVRRPIASQTPSAWRPSFLSRLT